MRDTVRDKFETAVQGIFDVGIISKREAEANKLHAITEGQRNHLAINKSIF